MCVFVFVMCGRMHGAAREALPALHADIGLAPLLNAAQVHVQLQLTLLL